MMGSVPVFAVDRTTLVPPEGHMWHNQLPLSPRHLPGTRTLALSEPKKGAHAAHTLSLDERGKGAFRIGPPNIE